MKSNFKRPYWTKALPALALLGTVGCKPSDPVASVALETELDSVSYSLGAIIGQDVKQQGFQDIDVLAYAKGMADVFENPEALAISFQQGEMLLMAYANRLFMAQADSALAVVKSFLEENAKKEGVEQTASGLQYIVLEPGEGDSPTRQDMVEVHYEGKFMDGTVFDSSYERGEPVTFGVTQVIAGWTEALTLMKPGAKWQLFVPPDLGYGLQGSQGVIPPNALLIFQVELLKVTPGQEQALPE